MGITLEQVKSAVDDGTKKSEDVRKEVAQVGLYLKKYFDSLAKDRLDKLEAEREKREKSVSTSSPTGSGSQRASAGRAGMMPGLLPALAGLPLALSGLRALPRLGALTPRVINSIGRGLRNLARGLGDFGRRLGRLARGLGRQLGNALRSVGRGLNRIVRPIRNALGRGLSRITRPITDAIRRILRAPGRLLNDIVRRVTRGRGIRGMGRGITRAISNAARGLRNRLFRMVGLGPDGRLLSLRDPVTGRFRTNNIGRAAQAVGRGASSVARLAGAAGRGLAAGGGRAAIVAMDAIGDVIGLVGRIGGAATRATAGLVGGAARILGSGVGGALRMMGRILWPVSILFALYDGVMAYQNAEGDTADRLAAGVGGFIGDLIGAPLNLLRDLTSWILNEMGFDAAAEWMQGFDFETMISDVVTTMFGWFRSGLQWFGLLLRDPVEALTQLWNGMLEGAANLGEWLWNNGLRPLGEWLLSFIPNPVPWIQEQWAALLGVASDIGSWIWTNAIEPVGNWFKTLFTDPVEALRQYLNTLFEGALTFYDFIWNQFLQPFVQWLGGLLGFEIPDLDLSATVRDIRDRIANWFSDLASYIMDRIRALNPFSGERTPEQIAETEELARLTSEFPEDQPATVVPRGLPTSEIGRRLRINPNLTGLRGTLTGATQPGSAAQLAELQAYLNQNNGTGTTPPMTNVVDGSTRTDNSVRQTNIVTPGANNVDPSAYAIPGFGF